jgi:hypothetical protein
MREVRMTNLPRRRSKETWGFTKTGVVVIK